MTVFEDRLSRKILRDVSGFLSWGTRYRSFKKDVFETLRIAGLKCVLKKLKAVATFPKG